MKKIIVLLFVFVSSLSFAYELPKIKVSKGAGKPEIVFFTANSIMKDDVQFYELKWKTLNADRVSITYLGDIELSGTLVITKKEFHSGPITLKAYSSKSDYVDKVTINGDKDVFDEPNPVPKNSTSKGRSDEFYDTIPNTHMNPYRRVRPGFYPRRHY
jgi:hypothetical protein